MSLLSDVTAALGTPAWGATIATGVVGFASMVEPGMRPEARKQIAGWLRAGVPGAGQAAIAGTVRHAFEATFGARQMSWLCLRRSLLASMLLVVALAGLFWSKHGVAIRARHPGDPGLLVGLLVSIPGFLVKSALPDWISLAKSRLILARAGRRAGVAWLVLWLLVDLVLSYAIAMVIYHGVDTLIFGRPMLCETMESYEGPLDCRRFDGVFGIVGGTVEISAIMAARLFVDPDGFNIANVMVMAWAGATLLTSAWTLTVLVSFATLRALLTLNPVLRLFRWAVDVEAHPVRVVGFVAGGLVWLASVAYAVA